MRQKVFFILLLCASALQAQEKKYNWKLHKAQLEQEYKIAERFIGEYKRNEDERIVFSISKESKYEWFRGKFIGSGKYDYEFAASDFTFQSDGTILFRIKGKLYRAKRIDESLELTFPDGKKKYCPRLADAADSKEFFFQKR